MPCHQASRTVRRAATVLPLAASLVVGLFGCAEANRILVSGNVDDDLVAVQAPQIEVPDRTSTPVSPTLRPGRQGCPRLVARRPQARHRALLRRWELEPGCDRRGA